MKKNFLTLVVTLFLLVCSYGIHAQTTQTRLNQIELMKQQIGTWKCNSSKDTTVIWDGKPYGTGLVCYYKIIVKGKTVMEGKELWGYDKASDKFINASLTKGNDMEIQAVWFISKNTYEYVRYSDISNPEKASWKIVGELKSPDIVVETTTENNKTTLIQTYTKAK